MYRCIACLKVLPVQFTLHLINLVQIYDICSELRYFYGWMILTPSHWQYSVYLIIIIPVPYWLVSVTGLELEGLKAHLFCCVCVLLLWKLHLSLLLQQCCSLLQHRALKHTQVNMIHNLFRSPQATVKSSANHLHIIIPCILFICSFLLHWSNLHLEVLKIQQQKQSERERVRG